jgi:dihydrofolate synthase/folylpolyglutamate synthase
VILDVGHNEDGMKQINKQLELTDYHHLHIVLGMVKDKEIDRILPLLPKQASYYFTQARIPRAMDAVVLQEKATAAGLSGNSFPEVNKAIQHVLAHAHKDDLVLVCGSVFLVGEVTL